MEAGACSLRYTAKTASAQHQPMQQRALWSMDGHRSDPLNHRRNIRLKSRFTVAGRLGSKAPLPHCCCCCHASEPYSRLACEHSTILSNLDRTRGSGRSRSKESIRQTDLLQEGYVRGILPTIICKHLPNPETCSRRQQATNTSSNPTLLQGHDIRKKRKAPHRRPAS